MKAQFRNLLFTLSLTVATALLTAVAAQAASIDTALQITSGSPSCVIGDCTTTGLQTGALNFTGNASSIPSTPFNVNFTFGNTDQYNFAGNYVASYGAGGSIFTVNVTAAYLGNGSHTASLGDTFALDFLQDFWDNTGTTWSGTYTENAQIVIGNTTGPSSTVSSQYIYNGQSVGLMGPYTGPGTYNGSNSTTLNGPSLTGTNFLAADYQVNYSLAAGASTGSTVSDVQAPVTSPTPEPAETVPMVGAFGWLCVMLYRKSRTRSV